MSILFCKKIRQGKIVKCFGKGSVGREAAGDMRVLSGKG